MVNYNNIHRVFRKFFINISPRDKIFNYDKDKIKTIDNARFGEYKIIHKILIEFMSYEPEELEPTLDDYCYNDDIIEYIMRMKEYYDSLNPESPKIDDKYAIILN